ncbi:hypothetical protein JL721_2400 [Aureococcus anophagefferens]|nr:hypothetical protein JL721_2400 [Aureococcus anophagefferens]
MTVAEGVSWVRRKIVEEKITNPDAAAPKEKVKLAGTVRGGAVVFASPGKDKTPEIRRLVFGAKPRGTRVKIDFKRRGVAGSNTENLGRVDMRIDDVILKNAMYPAGWVPFTHGDGKLQVRFFYLDPYEASFDGENVNRAAHDKAAAPAKPALARLTTDDEFADAVSGETVDVEVDDAVVAAEAAAKPPAAAAAEEEAAARRRRTRRGRPSAAAWRPRSPRAPACSSPRRSPRRRRGGASAARRWRGARGGHRDGRSALAKAEPAPAPAARPSSPAASRPSSPRARRR